MRSAATNVRNRALGKVMMERQKMASMARIRYCPSYIDHWCLRRARMASVGRREVSSLVMAVVGEPPRILAFVARHFRRSFWGIMPRANIMTDWRWSSGRSWRWREWIWRDGEGFAPQRIRDYDTSRGGEGRRKNRTGRRRAVRRVPYGSGWMRIVEKEEE